MLIVSILSLLYLLLIHIFPMVILKYASIVVFVVILLTSFFIVKKEEIDLKFFLISSIPSIIVGIVFCNITQDMLNTLTSRYSFYFFDKVIITEINLALSIFFMSIFKIGSFEINKQFFTNFIKYYIIPLVIIRLLSVFISNTYFEHLYSSNSAYISASYYIIIFELILTTITFFIQSLIFKQYHYELNINNTIVLVLDIIVLFIILVPVIINDINGLSTIKMRNNNINRLLTEDTIESYLNANIDPSININDTKTSEYDGSEEADENEESEGNDKTNMYILFNEMLTDTELTSKSVTRSLNAINDSNEHIRNRRQSKKAKEQQLLDFAHNSMGWYQYQNNGIEMNINAQIENTIFIGIYTFIYFIAIFYIYKNQNIE